MEYDQIIKCKDDGKPVLNIKQRQEEFIRRIKESGLHFRIKRIFRVIYPNLAWQHERKFTDNAMRYLKLFVKNDIPFILVPSEGMNEDLDRLQRNTPPLYDVVIGHLEAKENSSAGTQKINQDTICKLVYAELNNLPKQYVVAMDIRRSRGVANVNIGGTKFELRVKIFDTDVEDWTLAPNVGSFTFEDSDGIIWWPDIYSAFVKRIKELLNNARKEE